MISAKEMRLLIKQAKTAKMKLILFDLPYVVWMIIGLNAALFPVYDSLGLKLVAVSSIVGLIIAIISIIRLRNLESKRQIERNRIRNEISEIVTKLSSIYQVTLDFETDVLNRIMVCEKSMDSELPINSESKLNKDHILELISQMLKIREFIQLSKLDSSIIDTVHDNCQVKYLKFVHKELVKIMLFMNTAIDNVPEDTSEGLNEKIEDLTWIQKSCLPLFNELIS